MFLAALGLTAICADDLRTALLAAAQSSDATPGERDEFGERYVLDFSMTGPAGQAQVRSAWIVRAGEAFPRLTYSGTSLAVRLSGDLPDGSVNLLRAVLIANARIPAAAASLFEDDEAALAETV